MRKTIIVGAAAVLLSLLVLLPSGAARSPQEDQTGGVDMVAVSNFPKVQEVQGSVSVTGVSPHGQLVRRESVIVPPVRRNDTNALIPGGVIETEGFTEAVLSLQGDFKDSLFGPGAIGVVLVPEEEPIIRAMNEGKRIEFPLEVSARVATGDSPFFSSEQARLPVGFSRYRVYFYNSSNKGAEVNLYVYLAN